MSYQVLARKWRPHRFEDMVGQEHVLRALTNALDKNRLHHAYLFTGTRGVGKTTIARILSKSLNCEKGVSSNPCGECATCQDIDAGRFFDLIEVDAASRTKVDQTRELLENVPYAPTSGRYKVYLIDEVHMFSDHSFNALLKTLEEPPEHVKFLLATTDPQKVPVTVLSRCLQFSLKRLPERQISAYLADIMERESLEVESSALVHIARAADGSMRDALSLLDQAIAFGEGKVLAVEVESMLGRPSPDRVLDLVAAMGEGNSKNVMELVNIFAEYSPDFSGLLADIMSVLHQVALVQGVPGTQETVSFDPHRINELAVKLTAEDVHLFYQIGLIGRRDIALAPDMREGFEMTLLRMLAFRPDVLNSSHIAQATPVPAQPRVQTQNSPAPQATVGQSASDRLAKDTVEPDRNTRATLDGNSDSVSQNDRVAALKASLNDDSPRRKTQKKTLEKADPVVPVEVPGSIINTAPEPEPIENSPQDRSIETAVVSAPVEEDVSEATRWESIVKQLGIAGIQLELANNCILRAIEESTVKLVLIKEYESLLQPGASSQLEKALNRFLGRSVKLDITVESGDHMTPARINQQKADARLEAAKQSIEADPVVKKLCEQLDGVVQSGSIKPH